jgi:hypothetical protein
MREHVDLGGTTPPDEACAQVGSRAYDYAERARREARAYIGQLRRTFGDEPDGARLGVKSHAHDFGTYYTVVCHFDADDAAAGAYAFRCDDEAPRCWDEMALRELHLNPHERS